MLTITYPPANSTLPGGVFNIEGTCSANHWVTVRLTHTGSHVFQEHSMQAALGAWSYPFAAMGEGAHTITATCEGLNESISIGLNLLSSAGAPGGP